MPALYLTTDPVYPVGLARTSAPAAGGWLATTTRARKARTVSDGLNANGKAFAQVGAGQERWLTYSEMWTIYRRVPDVRAAVDSIVRRIATWNWLVEPTVDVASDEYEALLDEAETVRRFLATPNTDGETWQEVWTKAGTDLLVFDQCAIEQVRGKASSKLVELVAVRGSTVTPKEDEFGRLQGYEHCPGEDGIGTGKTTAFKPDELLFLRLYPTTAGPLGTSLIESIVDEVLTLLAAAKHVLSAYSVDEIPPGILVLTGIAGQAADRAKADLSEMRGDDHKIRVITSPDPTNAGARWVELRRTMKDLELRDVIGDIRRIIWRVFGVLPIEMGVTEAIPRATAEVQLEVGTSHLVNPILELIEAKVNARIVPLLVKPANVGKIAFRFDRDAKLSEEDKKRLAERLEIAVKAGIMTRNEARAELGLPPVEGGDVLTVDGAPKTLAQIIAEPEEEEPEDPEDPEDPDDPTDPDGGEPADGGEEVEDEDTAGTVSDDEAGEASEEDDAPGEAERSAKGPLCRREDETQQECIARVVRILAGENPSKPQSVLVAEAFDTCAKACGDARGAEPEGDRRAPVRAVEDPCPCGHPHQNLPANWGHAPTLVAEGKISAALALAMDAELHFRREQRLPSEWQDPSIFKGRRVLNLPKLGDAIARYARQTRPLWHGARDKVLAKVAAAYDRDRGGFTAEAAADLLRDVDETLDALAVQWKVTTEPDYIEAARLARDAAADWTGDADAVADYRDRAIEYQSRAMGYLTGDDGPIRAVRDAVKDVIRQGTRARPSGPVQTRGPEGIAEEKANALIEEARMLAIAEGAFAANEYRIFNWAGKLNDLSNETLTRGLEAVSKAEGVKGHVEWWAEWCYVGDERTCRTCEVEGVQGFRPLSQMPLRPGGDTECRARCRCVLVFWRKDEVDSGTAERFGPTGRSASRRRSRIVSPRNGPAPGLGGRPRLTRPASSDTVCSIVLGRHPAD